MELAAVFLLLLVFAFIVLFVSRPLFVRERIRYAGESPQLSALLAERERLLIALQELDSDQALGKIPAEDYPVQRTELLQKGVDILRRIDALVPAPEKAAAAQASGLAAPVSSPAPLTDEILEELLSQRRNLRKEKAGGFCPKCGKPVSISDVFCPSCGTPLKETSQ